MYTLKIIQIQLQNSCAMFEKYSQSIKRNNNIATTSQFNGCGLLSYGKSSSWHFKGM